MHVLDASATDESTVALREFNDMVDSDPRVECVMVPIWDGVTLIRQMCQSVEGVRLRYLENRRASGEGPPVIRSGLGQLF